METSSTIIIYRLCKNHLMNNKAIPTLLIATIMIAVSFAFMPVQEASAVHLTATTVAGSVTQATGEIDVTADAGSIDFNAVGATAGDITMDSGDDTTITAAGLMTVVATAGELDITSSAGAVDINAVGATAGDVTMNSGDDMTLTSVGIIDIDSATTVTIDSAAGEIDVTAEAGALDFNAIGATAGDITMNSGDDTTLTAAGLMTVVATAGELDITSSAGAVDINAVGATAGDITMNSGDDTTITAVGILSTDGATMGFFGTSPGTAAPDYAVTNDIATRIFNANVATIATTDDVLATVIKDLIAFGLFQ
jgi:hypothetical protein